jgi:hypothetical protein
MKRAALFASVTLCLCLNAFGQDSLKTETASPDRRTRLRNQPYFNNIIKTNLSTLALNNYSLTYERLIARKISASLGWRYMPKTYMTKTALTKEVMKYFEDGEGGINEQLDKLQMSGNAITAEIRFYTGRRPGAKGFYAGLYGRYSSFKYDYPYDFEDPMGEITLVPLKGKSSGIGGGFILGGQFNVHKRVIIDLYIIGGHYGSFSGKVSGLTDLSDLDEQDRADLKEDLESLIEIGDKKNITATVSDDGIRADVSMPFLGVRGLGFTVGFAF